jgi:hypothetical protein
VSLLIDRVDGLPTKEQCDKLQFDIDVKIEKFVEE